MNRRAKVKELFINAIILQFIIILAAGYAAYLVFLYPNYSDEFGFGREIELGVEGLNMLLTTGRTASTLTIQSELPVEVYLDNQLIASGSDINIRLGPYRFHNMSIVPSDETKIYIKLINEIPIWELMLSLLVIALVLPMYITNVRRLR